MTVRLIDEHGNLLGILNLTKDVLLIDLELLRRLGARRVEPVSQIASRTSESGHAPTTF